MSWKNWNPETRRWQEGFTRPDGTAIINDYRMESSSTAAGLAEYPEGCLEAMEKTFRCYSIKAGDLALELGNPKCMNVVLFGAMAHILDMDDIDWETVIKETVPPKFAELNIAAYRKGREALSV